MRLEFPNLVADMVELRIAIRMRRSFQRLPVRLQTLVHLMQKFGHHAVARLMSHPLEFGRQLPHAFCTSTAMETPDRHALSVPPALPDHS
jgi:hypothetical protein